MTDLIEGEVINESTALVPASPQTALGGALSLFGTTPGESIGRISEIADLLTDVLKKKGLYATIQGKNHVTVEGWTLLGSLLGVFPVVVSTERVTEPAEGYKARVEARTMSGAVVGAGEALCTRAEEAWSYNPKRGKARDDFALMAMAQTRATSRALRNPLGFVVKMAGYETAGAEEMPAEPAPAAPVVTEEMRSDVIALLVAKGEKATPELAAEVVNAHRDDFYWLTRAKQQLEAKPDKAAA